MMTALAETEIQHGQTTTCSDSPTSFLRQARRVVGDLFNPSPVTYWIDFLGCLIVGYGCAAVYLDSSLLTVHAWVCFVIAGCSLYRLGSFMHEIVHFRSGQMRVFRIAWDVLAGIPMLTPSFFYHSHSDNHNTQHYGTERDGEYLPLGRGPVRNIGYFLMQVFVQPVAVVLRFLLAR